jgi:hypothetical protein
MTTSSHVIFAAVENSRPCKSPYLIQRWPRKESSQQCGQRKRHQPGQWNHEEWRWTTDDKRFAAHQGLKNRREQNIHETKHETADSSCDPGNDDRRLTDMSQQHPGHEHCTQWTEDAVETLQLQINQVQVLSGPATKQLP